MSAESDWLDDGSQEWFGLLLFSGTFSTNRLYRAIGVQCISRSAGEQHNHIIEQ